MVVVVVLFPELVGGEINEVKGYGEVTSEHDQVCSVKCLIIFVYFCMLLLFCLGFVVVVLGFFICFCFFFFFFSLFVFSSVV